MAESPSKDYQPGDLFQILPEHGRAGWIGAIITASEIRQWGVQGFVHHVDTHDQSSRAYIRLKWDHIEKVGRAVLVPADQANLTVVSSEEETIGKEDKAD